MAADFQHPIVLSSSPPLHSPVVGSRRTSVVSAAHILSNQREELIDGHRDPTPPVKPMRKKAIKSKKAGSDTQVSRHFNPDVVDVEPTAEQVAKQGIDLGLVTATMRRRSWTPTGNDSPAGPIVGIAEEGQATSFRQMLSGFECQPTVDTGEAPATKKPSNATRKRKVDATDAPVRKRKTAAERNAAATKKQHEPKLAKASKTTKAPKAPKAPKIPKATRAKTVTDFAIAAYRKATGQGDSPDRIPVTAFFQPVGTQMIPIQDGVTTILEPESAAASKGKATVLQFHFPPPEKAQHKMRDQDFLFGTSSQLAREESPETLKYIQQALVESEEMAFASQTRSPDLNRSPTTTSRLRVAHAPHGTSLSVIPGESNLWSVAARDETQTMFIGSPRTSFQPGAGYHSLPGPVADPTHSLGVPEPDGSAVDFVTNDNAAEAFTPEPEGFETRSSPPRDCSMHDSGFVDISEVEKVHQQVVSDVPTSTKPSKGSTSHDLTGSSPHRPALQSIAVNGPSLTACLSGGLGLATTPPLASPRRSSPGSKENVLPTAGVVKRPRGRPRKNTTDAPAMESPKNVTSKAKAKDAPPKKRKASPAKAKKAQPTTPTKAKATPKRKLKSPTGIPQPSGSWHDIEEISDSEPDLSIPSPKRRTPSVPKPLALSPSPPPVATTTTEDPAGLSKSQSHTALFATITRTIRNAPRGNASRPSWLEKMLLYDPIVLEDLTAWLVAQGVQPDGSIGHATTVDPEKDAEAAATEGTKGKGKTKRKKKDETQVEGGADKAALQPWVVQRWCEANSICCLWKAGLRGGVRARY